MILLLLACATPTPADAPDDSAAPLDDSGADSAVDSDPGDTATDTGGDTATDTGGDTAADTGGDTAADTAADTATDTGGDTGGEEEAVADFVLLDQNPGSASYGLALSPRDYLEQASGWYFVHAT